MFQPLRVKASGRQAVAAPAAIPAPVKGWYVGDALALAPKGTAFLLENGFPQLDYIRCRRGSLTYASGMPNAVVQSLMTWTSGATAKFFACCNGGIYDVTSGGAVGSAVVTGATSSDWYGMQFTGTGGTFLSAINGADARQIFDGSTWGTSPAITGPTAALSWQWSFKNRLYVIEGKTLNAWYCAVDAIGGAATKFSLSSIFPLGGYLMTAGTWSLDSSSGVYELCVFISSEGEVAVYDGSYPGDTAWTLKGLYKVSKPLGRRCLLKAGGDLAIMTEDGIVPLSKVMSLDQIALQNEAITKPIAPAWRTAVLERTGLTGWQIVLWPLESMSIINLPKKQVGDFTQFVANARTGAWARYTGWDANCFAVFNDQLYYGDSAGNVVEAEVGGSDNGMAYTWTVFPSFTNLGNPGYRNQVKMIRPMITANFAMTLKATTSVDYDQTIPAAPTASPNSLPGAEWGSAIWGVDVWPVEVADQSAWLSAENLGEVIAPILQVTISISKDPDVRLSAIQVLAERGNPIG